MKSCCAMALSVALATPALAADCQAWKAAVEQDEGGPAMMASICASNRPDDVLLITCDDTETLSLRFLPMTGDEFPPGGDMNHKSSFAFTSGPLRAEIILHHEAMDGAMTATPRRDSDIVRILKSAGPLTVTDKSGALPAATFTLKGSSRAIGMVERACDG